MGAEAPLRTDVVRDLAGLTAMATEWDALVRSTARPSPFLLNDWVAAWWRHLGTGGTLSVVTAHRAGRLVAAAPLYVRRSRGLRVCRLLGGHESALGDVLAADDDVDAAAAVMRRVEDLPFDYLDAFGMPSGSVLVRHAPPGALTTLERVEAPVMLMPDGWDAAYTAKTGSKKRNLHRRRLRQLGELGPLRWEVARTPEEVGAAIGPAFEIHARRWQGRPDGSTFGTATGRAFHRQAAAALAADGYVRIVTLHVADRPVAFHYYFAVDRTMYVHRLAFDPDLARFSPGQVTLLHTLEQAADEGIDRVEFLGGDERYKLELADAVAPMHQAIGMARNPLGHGAVRVTLGVIAARKRLKRNATVKRAYDTGLAPVRRVKDRLTGR